MSFSCADNERFNDVLVALAEGKYDALAAAYACRCFENETARAFASQGFLRRFELMKHCILGSMEPFPPRISWAPNRFNILDAVIQASVARAPHLVAGLEAPRRVLRVPAGEPRPKRVRRTDQAGDSADPDRIPVARPNVPRERP